MAAADAGRAGDSVANATHDLYRQYGKQIYAYCLHQLRSREEAEDAVQTTFLNAFRGLQRGTTTRFEQAWLYKIAQNVCIARRSSSGRRLRLEAPDDFEILEELVPAGSGSAADTLELMGLDDALEQMPDNQRRAILLREWQGLSYREIASELKLSQGAVEMLIFRARRTLATALEEPTPARRRTGKAKTGFSFGSLIAAMKGLFSTGAAVKMAAVAVSAAVVGTNPVHSVVHPTRAPRHARTAAAPLVQPARSSSPTLGRTSGVEPVSFRPPRATLTAAAGGTSDRKQPGVQDAAAPPASGRSATDEPSATDSASSERSVSLVTPTTVAAEAPPRDPTPPVTPGGSSSSEDPSGSPMAGGGHPHGTDGSGPSGKGNVHGHQPGTDQAGSTTTSTTATEPGDASSPGDTAATTTVSTTTPAEGGGDTGSSGSSPSADGPGDNGHGHGGANGNGNGGNGPHGHGQ